VSRVLSQVGILIGGPTIDPPFPRRRLALFPLPVVLLPGAPMPLHIFEPRYRDMVRDALVGDGRFGLVYHDWDRRGPFLMEEGQVGCVAEIERHEELADGRFLIVVRGRERFSIADGIESDALYFEALVAPYEDRERPGGVDLAARRQETVTLFRHVMRTLPGPSDPLPDFPTAGDVSFALAELIHADPEWYQEILELREELTRLERLDEVFRAALEG